jgi:hypothetical protein
MEDWEAIELVPKDGTEVDLWGLDWEGKGKRWCCARWEPNYRYEGDGGAWVGPYSDGFESEIPGDFTPTHWRRPPPPPSS